MGTLLDIFGMNLIMEIKIPKKMTIIACDTKIFKYKKLPWKFNFKITKCT